MWTIIESLALESVKIINWEKRKRNLPKNALCTISVDGTVFKTQEPQPFDKAWMSAKFKGAALKYEVAISIFSGDIVWIYGPHRGGKHDLTIFREQLLAKLEEGELVEADQGYRGEATWIRVRDDYSTKAEKREKDRIRARHEACNRRFKCWGILKQEYRHDLKKHLWLMRAIGGFTQLAIDNGGCLFGCEPMTKPREVFLVDDIDLDLFKP